MEEPACAGEYGGSENIMIYFNIKDVGALAEAARTTLRYIKQKPHSGGTLDFTKVGDGEWLTYDPGVLLKEPAHQLIS